MTQQTGNIPPAPADVASELSLLSPIAEFRDLEVYHFSGNDCPETLRSIGYLREEVFRASGSGRGVACDLDNLDTGEYAYYQLIAWDPIEQQLVAVYRYQPGQHAAGNEKKYLRTANLFDYSDTFRNKMLPHAIELGRSVVNPAARRNHSGFYALWKGLGTLIKMYGDIQYFFGTVSLYSTMDDNAGNCLLAYLQRHYPPPEPLLKAKKENHHIPRPTEAPDITSPVAEKDSDTPVNRIKKLDELMKACGDSMPPILRSYMSLSNDIWFDDSIIDFDFGNAYVIGLIVPIRNIHPRFRKIFI